MKHVNRVSVIFLVVLIFAFAGCKSKQEKPAESGEAVPQKPAAASVPTAPAKTAVPAASPKEMSEARAAALRVLAQMEAGDFAAIYRNASPGFKQIGSEAAFVTKFNQTRQKTGVLKNPKELRFDTRPGNIHVLLYRVENPGFISEMRLSFETKDGKMLLAGLNQHDEPRK